MKACIPPRGAFKGVNLMTPEVIGHWTRTRRGRAVYIEISTGRGLDNETIWGVTFRHSDGSHVEDDPSDVVWSLKDAHELAENG